jgi:BirA family biotin operon repressor/biotin-[acetyl-CoA-carboxylase] ligase
VAGFALGPRAAARGYRLFGHDSIGSTSSEAMQAGLSGDAGELWVASLQQTAGRGRRGRPWQSPPGNLAASLLILPEADAGVASTLGFVAGVALQKALEAVLPDEGRLRIGIDGADGAGGGRIALKWPNDVLADGRKLAGILLEAQKRPDGRLVVVIGFGVNVVAAPADLPYPAAALAGMGLAVSAESLFAALSETWLDSYELWAGGRGIADVLSLWRKAAAGIGAEVAISRDGEVLRGIFETIDEAGRLIVNAAGRRLAISAGDVHFGATWTARQQQDG